MAYSPPGMRLGPRLTPVVTWLIGLSIACFLVFQFATPGARETLARLLVLTPGSLLSGHLWKIVTTAFCSRDGLAFFIDLLVLWMFVPTLESAWGRKRFLTFFFLTVVAGHLTAALFALLIGTPAVIVGLGPFIYGSIAAFGVAWGDQPVQFFGVVPMKGRTLAIGIAVILLVSVVLNGAWVDCVDYFAAMLAAILFAGNPRLWLLRLRRERLKRRYTVLRGGAGEGKPTGGRSGEKWLN
jgi:membrane associated rhomboid family serine protease